MKRQIEGLSHKDKFLSTSSTSHSNIPFTRLRFHQVIEILVCTIALVFSWVFSDWELHDRPIPFQYLEKSGEYVRDLKYDELAWILVGIAKEENWFNALHAIVCTNFSAMAMVWFVGYAIKCHVGYLRPVFYKYCEPSDDYQDCTLHKDFIHYSFPSAHTSEAFCGMTILALFLDQSWRQYNQHRCLALARDESATADISSLQKKVGYEERLVSLLCRIGPFSVACWVGCTRISSNYHFPADVLAGAILGSSIAYYCYGLWLYEGRDVYIYL